MKRYIATFAAILLFASGFARADSSDLTGEIWSVCGTDGRSTWHGTLLVFTQHISDPEGDRLTGYFDWRSSSGSFGREHFDGVLHADGALILQGYKLESDINIVTSSYEAKLASDGVTILDGMWFDGIPGTWAAVQDRGRGTAVQYCDTEASLS